MERVPSLPPVREPTLRDENREIHVAELIGLTAREGSEQHESLERRLGNTLGELEDPRPLSQPLGRGPARPVVELDHEGRFSHRLRSRLR
jgi:hypothetical protein